MRTGLLLTMAIVAVALGVAQSARSAVLYLDGSHSVTVPTPSQASTTNTAPVVITSATFALNTCSTSTLTWHVVTNTGGTVVLTAVSGTFTGCAPLAMTGIYTAPWRLTFNGGPATSGSTTLWTGSVSNIAFSMGGGTYTGALTTGVTARQLGGGGATCINFNDSGTFTGPLTTNGRLDTTYCFEGPASSFSFG